MDKTLEDGARRKVAKIVKQAILVNAWSGENCLKWADIILAAIAQPSPVDNRKDASHE